MNRKLDRTILVALAVGLGLGWTEQAAATLVSQCVASGLARPIYVAAPEGDDRLFIVEQRGVIKILQDGLVLPTPFLDIDNLVPDITGNDERGLLGLAFHPGYAANGQFYVDYTDLQGDTVIARYNVSGDANVADPGSASIFLTIDQPYPNHKGGTLAFGPLDGYLYIGMGDGGSAGDPENRAQDDGSMLGKMLRIDVDGTAPYAIPPTNPFAGPGLPLDEIWSKGVRNPYRWSFDRTTGDLWIADVGQDNWEEIDFQPAGAAGGTNYGWRRMEGIHCYNPASGCNDGSLTLPIYEYSHGGSPYRCSITGGNVYRGQEIAALAGTYFFADFCSDQIWSFRYVGATISEFTERTAELAPGGGLSIADIAAFGEDGHGEMYIVDRGSGSNGEIYKIGLSPAGIPPGSVRSAPRVSPARPNPFGDATSIQIDVAGEETVFVEIFDAAGRLVRELAGEAGTAGPRVFLWNGREENGVSAPSGIYFIRCLVDGEPSTRRVLRIR